ncbi:hypothetical protein G7Z17_g2958 [Cylindrodendrum hubeiense]|uniref:Uncharacterized protein n=1 Tax=Cylindrodendrum hubeiense TaxID=595255 RepID=A0A9P5HFJ3_9HYPO|nr:hypothetical protein G7Z17_g2958 [Cylindrodendrum hubeiense]
MACGAQDPPPLAEGYRDLRPLNFRVAPASCLNPAHPDTGVIRSSYTPPTQRLLSPVGEQKLSSPKPDAINERIARVPPPEVVVRAEPAEDEIQVVTKIIAAAQDKETHKGTEMNGPAAIMLIDNERIDKASHGSAHS